ncbi:MAG: Eco57I restriction-modification methylase domain-containing protein [Clostridia bacterium]|nr:Eco57I restriction-modification methylase domain-containing protein [Clostridia bacterium]
MAELFNNVYNPDVLSCLANLSNDEVFTPPEVVNQMLDMLPQELFQSPDTTFLDPACKTGVFLREIAKRLLVGLEKQIPDLQARVDHIFHKQLFGIAITELTSLLTRRGIYCSKYPNSEYSVTKFDNPQGNIRYKRISHTWQDGKCIYCGANKEQYDRGEELETHAYEFIHTTKLEDIFDMKFDVIIGNPPYQLSDGGAQASAVPIYHEFVEQAKKLQPQYLTMISPARWMTGGRGLDEFRKTMIFDKHIKVLHDFADATDCFNGVEIKGGVCYFLYDNKYEGKCQVFRHANKQIRESFRYLVEPGDEIYIRDDRLISIKNKVLGSNFVSFETIASSMKPYGLRGDVFKNPGKYGLPTMSTSPIKDGYSIVGLENLKRTYRYIPKDYPLPTKNSNVNNYKIFITRNWGIGSYDDLPSSPIVANPGEICTETFIEFAPFETREQAENAYKYLCTKFFRTLVAIRKQDQGASKSVYHYVPLLDFSKPWTDEELYAKYGLTQEEIDFIESMIKPME